MTLLTAAYCSPGIHSDWRPHWRITRAGRANLHCEQEILLTVWKPLSELPEPPWLRGNNAAGLLGEGSRHVIATLNTHHRPRAKPVRQPPRLTPYVAQLTRRCPVAEQPSNRARRQSGSAAGDHARALFSRRSGYVIGTLNCYHRGASPAVIRVIKLTIPISQCFSPCGRSGRRLMPRSYGNCRQCKAVC